MNACCVYFEYSVPESLPCHGEVVDTGTGKCHYGRGRGEDFATHPVEYR